MINNKIKKKDFLWLQVHENREKKISFGDCFDNGKINFNF